MTVRGTTVGCFGGTVGPGCCGFLGFGGGSLGAVELVDVVVTGGETGLESVSILSRFSIFALGAYEAHNMEG